MEISDVYKRFPVPELLQKHQFRAAAVGVYICDHFKDKSKIDKDLVTRSLLLHDLGNIVKFNLTKVNYFTPEEYKNIDFWKEQQKVYREKYNNDEHYTTQGFIKDLGLQDVNEIIIQMSISNLDKIMHSTNYNLKVVAYSDLRCAPFTVVTINERFDDLTKRYKGSTHHHSDSSKVGLGRKLALELESQLQKEVLIPLDKITEASVKSSIISLSTYEIDN